jgi:hypothetical protein
MNLQMISTRSVSEWNYGMVMDLKNSHDHID